MRGATNPQAVRADHPAPGCATYLASVAPCLGSEGEATIVVDLRSVRSMRRVHCGANRELLLRTGMHSHRLVARPTPQEPGLFGKSPDSSVDPRHLEMDRGRSF